MAINSERDVHPALRRQALLILGMHRSGTSALAGMFSSLGARAPKNLLPGAKDNPRGFWESAELVKFHDKILQSSGSRWNDWEPFNPDWMNSVTSRYFLEHVPSLLEGEYGDAPLLLLKDPRICRFMPFWIRALNGLNIDLKVVIPLRHPAEVASSLEKRNSFGRNRSLLIWLRYILEAERETRQLDRCFVRYEDVLGDWRKQVRRAAAELKMQWPRWSGAVEAEIDAFLSSELRHHTALEEDVSSNPELERWISQAYSALNDLVGSNESTELAQRVLDGIRCDFDERSSIFASVVFEHEILASKDVDESRRKVQEQEAKVVALENECEKLKAELAASQEQVASHAVSMATADLSRQLAARDKIIADTQDLLSAREKELEFVKASAMEREQLLSRDISAKEAELQAKSDELDKLKSSSEKLLEEFKQQTGEWAAQIDAGVRHMIEVSKDLSARNGQQSLMLGERTKEVEQLTKALIKADKKIAEREADYSTLQSQLRAMEQSRAWRLTSSLRKSTNLIRRLRRRDAGTSGDVALVERSGWFDTTWYVKQYPDVAASGIEPIRHYLEFGAKEGRNPGPTFDTNFYLAAYPDVAASGINPLVHFIQHGLQEERKPVYG